LAEAEAEGIAIMIAGHFGFAALVKARERSTPLWILMLATVWLDIVFVPLFLAGIESIETVPGRSGYGSAVIYADYTHSIIGVVALSAILGGIAGLFWEARIAFVVAFVSASHWVLDLMVHRADMPIFPRNYGNLPRLGFGLWRSPAASIAVELALVMTGAWAYWRAARETTSQAKQGKGRAVICSSLIAVFGILVLWLDATGIR
jgi:hypothetical protein